MGGWRMVIAVSPRLLGDTLCRALTTGELVALSVDRGAPAHDGYDVAVVSPGRETEVTAGQVITVTEDGIDLADLRMALASMLQRTGD